MKYRRQKVVYHPLEERIKTWNEITDYGAVRSNIREQAARYITIFFEKNFGRKMVF